MVSYTKKGANQWKDASTTLTTYTIANLTKGTEYEIKVTAANGSTTGTASDILVASTTVNQPDAEKILTAKTLSDTQVQLSWSAMNNAVTYDLQYYAYSTGWTDVPGATNLIARSYVDTQKKCSGYLYRVIGRNAVGDAISVSAPVIGTTNGLTVTQDNYKVTIKWDAVSDAKSYTLRTYIPNLGSATIDGFKEFTGTTATIYLAPGDIHSFNLISNHTDGTSKVVFSGLSVLMPEMNVSDTSDNSTNAKLLYLERAINKTKYINDEIKVDYKSVTDCEIYYLKGSIAGIINKEYNSVKEVQSFFDTFSLLLGETLEASYTDTVDEHITFRLGVGKTSKDKTVQLKYILEPTTNSKNFYLAYIYGAQNPANWKNGFSKVNVTKNADGSYNYEVVIKQEKITGDNSSLYHKGLFESADSISESDGAKLNSATLGETTLKAKIGADGYLQTYSIVSPFDSDTELTFTSFGTVKTKIRGTSNIQYTFTK